MPPPAREHRTITRSRGSAFGSCTATRRNRRRSARSSRWVYRKQHHTQCLADFVVQTAVAAHRSGVDFTGFYRENTLCLRVGDDCLYPDTAFQLVEPDGSEFGFFTEIDAGTERIASPKDVESWERKIRLYDRLQDQNPKRFRVLIVSTRSRERVRHILDLAGTLTAKPAPVALLRHQPAGIPGGGAVAPVRVLPRPPRPSGRAPAGPSHPHACLEPGFDASPATEQAPLSVNIGTRTASDRRLCWTPCRCRANGRQALPPPIGHPSEACGSAGPTPNHTLAGWVFLKRWRSVRMEF